MGHIPKKKYVGDHGGKYVDLDGMTKQFTYVDHDKKTKIHIPLTEEEKKELQDSIAKRKEETILEILAMPAVNVMSREDTLLDKNLYNEFVLRHKERKEIFWNEEFLRKACNLNEDLARTLHLRVWRNTVKEQYWFEDLSHEEMIAKKWKKWAR